MTPQIIEGTWEEIKSHEAELSGKLFRLVPLTEPSTAGNDSSTAVSEVAEPAKRGSAFGKSADMFSLESYLQQKQDDIDLEDRRIY